MMTNSIDETFKNREAYERENRIEIYHKPKLSAQPLREPKTMEEATGKSASQILNEIAEISCWLPIPHKSKNAVKFMDFAFCFSQLTEQDVDIYWADGVISVELVSPAMYFFDRSQAMLAALILLCDDFAVISRNPSGDEILLSLRLESHEIFLH